MIARKPLQAFRRDWWETKLGHRCGGKNLPLESFFRHQLCWFVAIDCSFSNCLPQDKRALACDRRCLLTDIENTQLPVNFHFRQDVGRSNVVATLQKIQGKYRYEARSISR